MEVKTHRSGSGLKHWAAAQQSGAHLVQNPQVHCGLREFFAIETVLGPESDCAP